METVHNGGRTAGSGRGATHDVADSGSTPTTSGDLPPGGSQSS